MAGSPLHPWRNPPICEFALIASHRTEWTRNAARRHQILPRRRDQGGDLFVHISEVDENFDTLAKGQRVSFEEGASRRTGRPEAKNVTVIEASIERVRRYG